MCRNNTKHAIWMMNTTDEDRLIEGEDEQTSQEIMDKAITAAKQKRLQQKMQDDPSAVAGAALLNLAMQETQKWLVLMKKNKDSPEPLFDKVTDLIRVMEMALRLNELSRAEDVKNPYRVQQMPPEQYAKIVIQAWETWVFLWESRHPGQYLKREKREEIRGVIEAVLTDRALPAQAMEYRIGIDDAPPIEELRARYAAEQEEWEPWGARKGKEEE